MEQVHQLGLAGAKAGGARCGVGGHVAAASSLKASKSECKGETASSLRVSSWDADRFRSVCGVAASGVTVEDVQEVGSIFTFAAAGGEVGGGRFGSAAASPPSRRPQPLQDEVGLLPAVAAAAAPASCCSIATSWAWLLSILESSFVAVSTCWCSR